MATQRELTMKLMVDAKAVKAAAGEMDKLATSTKKVGSEAAKTQQTINQAAAARIEAARRQDAIQARMARLDPAMGGRPGFQVPGLIKALLGLGAVNAGARGAADFLGNAANNPERMGLANMLKNAGKQLPGVGGLVELGDVAFGDKVPRAIAAKQFDDLQARFDMQRHFQENRMGGQMAIEQQRAMLQEAQGKQAGAHALAARLRGANAGDLFTEGKLGASTEATGALRLADEMARSEFVTAQAQQRQAQGERDAQAAKQREAEAEAIRASGAAIDRQMELDRARKANDGNGFMANMGRARARNIQPGRGQLLEDKFVMAQGNAQQAAREAEEARLRVAQEVEKTKGREQALLQKNVALANAQAEAEKKQGDFAKDKLTILAQQKQRLEGGFTDLAFADQGTLQNTLAAVQQAKARGIGTLTPDQRGLLQNPLTQEFFRDKALEFGQQNPMLQRIGQEAGLGDLKQIRQEIIGNQNIIKEQMAKTVKENADNIVKTYTESLAVFSKLVKQGIELANRQALDEAAREKEKLRLNQP